MVPEKMNPRQKLIRDFTLAFRQVANP